MTATIAQLPPTLAPPSVRALVRGLRVAVQPPRGAEELERELRALYGDEIAVTTFCSGRAALTVAIESARRATGRSTVVLPAYTSFSVAAAAAAAGARVRLCDLDPETLDFDREDLRRCVDERTAAVVLGNPYGYPSATGDLGWVRELGVQVIDDAAQALGATEGGTAVGVRGDLGVLSFGRGKCVTTGGGGALLVCDRRLRAFIRSVPRPNGAGLLVWLTALGVRVSANRWIFGLASRIPAARIGESRYDPGFDITRPPAVVQGLASGLADAVVSELAVRRRVAGTWMTALRDMPGVRTPVTGPGARPSYLRVPVLLEDRATRERAVRKLAAVGMRFVRSYPTTLAEIPEFRQRIEDRPTPRATAIADRLLGLPCHRGVRQRDVGRAVEVLRRLAEPSAGATRRAALSGSAI